MSFFFSLTPFFVSGPEWLLLRQGSHMNRAESRDRLKLGLGRENRGKGKRDGSWASFRSFIESLLGNRWWHTVTALPRFRLTVLVLLQPFVMFRKHPRWSDATATLCDALLESIVNQIVLISSVTLLKILRHLEMSVKSKISAGACSYAGQ